MYLDVDFGEPDATVYAHSYADRTLASVLIDGGYTAGPPSPFSEGAAALTETATTPVRYQLADAPDGAAAEGWAVVRVQIGDEPADDDPIVWAGRVYTSPPPPPPGAARPVPLAWGLPAAGGQDVRLAAGEDLALAFTPRAGTDPDDSGAAVAFACRHPLTAAVVLTADAAPAGGAFTLALAAADTAGLTPGLAYPWDAWRADDGAAAQLARGRLIVLPSQQ